MTLPSLSILLKTQTHTVRQEAGCAVDMEEAAAEAGQQEGSVAAAAAKVLTAKMPGSMAVRAYLQLPSLKKAPPEVGGGQPG